MRSKLLTDLAVAVGFLMFAGPMLAHHSSSIYDREHPVTLTGTVTALELINPHSRIRFEVKDDQGNIEKWVALSGAVSRMFRAGWRRDTLKPGDQITITGAPVKDGGKVMSLIKLVGPTGQVLTTQGAG
ncbi:MAG: DUF6152 family protein [Acidobacteria bacterium]|nr:DUF6152 family protein [Acidobacteriota bacterium]